MQQLDREVLRVFASAELDALEILDPMALRTDEEVRGSDQWASTVYGCFRRLIAEDAVLVDMMWVNICLQPRLRT